MLTSRGAFIKTTPRLTGMASHAGSDAQTSSMPPLTREEDGLRLLMGLRAELLSGAESRAAPELKDLDASLLALLTSRTRALTMQRLEWASTSAALLEKVMHFERVHPFDGWSDLRRRVDGPGRHLFAFVHPSMPTVPLAFVQCCLLDRVPSRLADVLPAQISSNSAGGTGSSDSSDGCASGPLVTRVDTTSPRVAVFYSISSPLIGLRGLPLGGQLIKRALMAVAAETRVTLSPVPGFRTWLEAQLVRREAGATRALRDGDTSTVLEVSVDDGSCAPSAEDDSIQELVEALDAAGLSALAPFEPGGAFEYASVRAALMSLCARYLCVAKKGRRPLDSVASFHLGNGATLLNLHWAANASARGLRESAGIMVNYEYREPLVDANRAAFVASGTISVAPSVLQLVAREKLNRQ